MVHSLAGELHVNIVFGVSLIGIIVGSRLTGKKIGQRGWLNGGIVGLLYVAVLLILGFCFLDNLAFNFLIFSKLFIGFAFGALGGMFGVNA